MWTIASQGKLSLSFLEQLAALLSDGELDAAAGGAGATAGGVTAVSAAADDAEPSMLMDMALHHVLAPLLVPPAAGRMEFHNLYRSSSP